MSININSLALAKSYTDNSLRIPGPQGIQGVAGPQGPKGDKGEPGVQGSKGEPGNDGATFIPTVDYNGNLSWSNNQNLPNPATINIKGPKGDSGGGSSEGGNIVAKYYNFVSVEPSQWRSVVVSYKTGIKFSVVDVPTIPVKGGECALWSYYVAENNASSVEDFNHRLELYKTIFEMRCNSDCLRIISSSTTLPDIALFFNIVVFSK